MSPSSTPVGAPLSSHTMPPLPSVTRMRTGEADEVFSSWVHLSALWELFVAAQPPPSYRSRRTAILPRQCGGGGGSGRAVLHCDGSKDTSPAAWAWCVAEPFSPVYSKLIRMTRPWQSAPVVGTVQPVFRTLRSHVEVSWCAWSQ